MNRKLTQGRFNRLWLGLVRSFIFGVNNFDKFWLVYWLENGYARDCGEKGDESLKEVEDEDD